MKNILSRKLRKLLPISYYNKIREIYNFRSKSYNLQKDLEYNEDLFKKFNFNINEIKSRLRSQNILYEDENVSWHYHLSAGLKDYFKNKKINILEIGTSYGNFTNFISKIYDDCIITTIDLNDGSLVKKEVKKFLEIRKNNLNRKNINFIKLHSTNIKKYFNGKKFDFIWVDGDHLNPQVTIDIINSLDLLNDDGIISTDDVIPDKKFKKTHLVSNEGYLTLKNLEDNKILKNFFLLKRIRKSNYSLKKYISVSTFTDNSKLNTKSNEII